MMLPTVLDIYDARRRLAAHLGPTPLRQSPWLSSIADGSVFLKLESLNLTHSFKIRGALNAALKLMESADAGEVEGSHALTVVTASAGNHGRALALAAEKLGLSCVVFTPANAPETKKNAITRHGAVLHGDCEDYDVAETKAREFAVSEGATYISPYNNPDVIAGAGTVGLDLVEAMPSFDVVVIPLGGGGLASGVGLAVKAAAPRVTIVGVEVEASAPFTFELVKQVVDYVVTVSEDELVRAMRGLAAEEHLIVEGAGAAATAAVIAGKASAPGQRVISLVTGGNVDLPKWLFAVS